MKLTTVMLASLITLTSAAAFAEGGAERSKAFYKNFNLTQTQIHGTQDRIAAADGNDIKKDSIKQSADENQPKI